MYSRVKHKRTTVPMYPGRSRPASRRTCRSVKEGECVCLVGGERRFDHTLEGDLRRLVFFLLSSLTLFCRTVCFCTFRLFFDMGIKNLTKLLMEQAPEAFKEETGPVAYTGTKVAIDASMALYQFMVAVRSAENAGGGGPSMQLTNEAGEITSHIQGFFSRTIRLMEKGTKPVWVFDGKAPDLKGGELAKRKELKEAAAAALKEAQESGDVEKQNQMQKRTVRVTKEHNEDVKTLLRLMGCPVIEAPMEAEAQCAELAKKGHVFAAASEDMDTLTFGTPKLLRKFTAPESKKVPIMEINLAKAVSQKHLHPFTFPEHKLTLFFLLFVAPLANSTRRRSTGPPTAGRAENEYGRIHRFVYFVWL